MQTTMDHAICQEDIDARVRAITIDVLGLEAGDIWPDARFREDLGADSLDLVELIVAFGRVFNVQICDAEVQFVETVSEVVSYIAARHRSDMG